MYSSKKIKIKEQSSSASIPKEAFNKEGEKLFQSDGQLAVDVYENDSDFVVLTAIAGVSPKDIEIQIDKDMLIIKGRRPNPENNENKNYFYKECHWGSFSRKIILPEDIDITKALAEFNKGLLMIKFPKNLVKNKKEISVKES